MTFSLDNHEARLREDAASRERALALASFIVEAPAGAGKTELLTQRFLTLLKTVQAPEEIIAITFTNKAASEMKSRIMASLEMAHAGKMPPQPHKQTTFQLGLEVLVCSAERGWHLLDMPSRLRIYTIDSLSANLARQMPLLSRFGTQPRVRDDASLLYQEAATKALEHLDTAGLSAVVQASLRYFDNDTFRLTALLSDMLAKRDQWLPYLQATKPEDAMVLAESALAHMVQQELTTVEQMISQRFQAALMPIARFAASQLGEDATIAPLLDWQTPLTADCENLPMWRALVELMLTKDGHLRKEGGLNVKSGFPATDEGRTYKKALAEVLASIEDADTLLRVRRLPDTEQDETTWRMIAALGQLLSIAVAELWLIFQARGEVDFVEISQRSLMALEDNEGQATELAMKLDYKIQHLLVDEFQDTSPTQIKLIKALTRGWQADDGRTLFCVGDPMQSIYRFRKANVGLFLRVAQQGIGDLKLTPLKLWRNNRSCPPVVEWVNHAFAQIFPAQDSSAFGAIRYRPFVATKDTEAGSGVFTHALLNTHPLPTASADSDDEENESLGVVSDIRQCEADKIISIIHETRSEDPNRSIAVLVRARSHLHALVTQIRRYHPELSFQAVEIEELANRQIVQDLLSLTHALHQRADRVHWLAVLRAPWCGLTLADMHALVSGDRHSTVMQLMHNPSRLQRLSEDGLKRVLHVREVMQQALQHYGRTSTSRWLHSVWLMLGGPDCLWDSNDVNDVQAFFERVQSLEDAGQFSPEQLAVEVQKLYAAPDAKAPDTLQFMTIHKSKGLEFDTVILPGLDRGTNAQESPLLLWEEVSLDAQEHNSEERAHDAERVDLVVAPYIPKWQKSALTGSVAPYDYLKQLEKERAEYEDARVLYVAATRAQRCLHLLGVAKPDKNSMPKSPKGTFLDMLWPILAAAYSQEDVIKPTIEAETTQAQSLSTFVPKLVRLVAPQILPMFQADTATPLAEGYAVSAQHNANTIEADVGTLTHVYLQMIANDHLDHWSDSRLQRCEPAMVRWFKQRQHAPTHATDAAHRVKELLLTALNSQEGQWVLEPRPTAASELALESIRQSGSLQAVQKRIIDRTFIESGTRWIIDYKTVALETNVSEAALTAIAEQYRDQLEGYEQFFQSAPEPIQKAIFFVSIGKLVRL